MRLITKTHLRHRRGSAKVSTCLPLSLSVAVAAATGCHGNYNDDAKSVYKSNDSVL